MTRDDVIKMAREAGLRRFGPLNIDCELERFAALVAAHEREACAQVCEEVASTDMGGEGYAVGMSAADAIRSRAP